MYSSVHFHVNTRIMEVQVSESWVYLSLGADIQLALVISKLFVNYLMNSVLIATIYEHRT